jgi:hypothetical protein
MRGIHAVALVAALGGCTSVKLAQRDGCWVRRTEKLGTVKEELGPCARPASPWSDDRLTRLVQECVAGADYRWQSRALVAWSGGQRMPDRDPEATVLQECISESTRRVLMENEKLTQRLADVSGEREALRARDEADRSQLARSFDKVADYLGEAAKKASPPATATATASSEGRSEGRIQSEEASAAPTPVAIVNTSPPAPAACPSPARPATKRVRAVRSKPSCPVPSPAVQVPVTPAGAPAIEPAGGGAKTAGSTAETAASPSR